MQHTPFLVLFSAILDDTPLSHPPSLPSSNLPPSSPNLDTSHHRPSSLLDLLPRSCTVSPSFRLASTLSLAAGDLWILPPSSPPVSPHSLSIFSLSFWSHTMSKKKVSLTPKPRGRPRIVPRGRRADSDDELPCERSTSHATAVEDPLSQGIPPPTAEYTTLLNLAAQAYTASITATEQLQTDTDNKRYYVPKTQAHKDDKRKSLGTLRAGEVPAFFDTLVRRGSHSASHLFLTS